MRGEVNDVDIERNGGGIWNDAPIRGQLTDCPPDVGGFEYRIEAQGPGGTSVATRYVEVVRQTQPTPTPTPTATSVPPAVVQSFSVSPQQIFLGECVSIVWGVGGDPALIQIRRNGQVIFDNAPYTGSAQDCPPLAGSYVYRIEVTDRSGRISDAREVMVNVVQQATATPTPTLVATTEPTPTPTATTQPPPEAPVIEYLTVAPPQITLGECVTLAWSYRGQDIAAASLLRGDEKLMGDPPPVGELVDCPIAAGVTTYRLQVSSEFAGTTEASAVLNVLAP